VEDMITLGQLWAIFRKIKRVEYGSSIEIGGGFKVDTEMLYNSYQKELNAQARIGLN